MSSARALWAGCVHESVAGEAEPQPRGPERRGLPHVERMNDKALLSRVGTVSDLLG